MKFLVTEIREIRVSCEIEAPNAGAAINIYKKDPNKHAVSFSEETHVTVYDPAAELEALFGPPEQEDDEA